MSVNLKANLVYKGGDGLSAYEIAVKNGYTGTEEAWVSSLGVVGSLVISNNTTTVSEATSTVDLIEDYSDKWILQVFKNGLFVSDSDYTVDTENMTITFNTILAEGDKIDQVLICTSVGEIPTNISAFTNDAGYTTESDVKTIQDSALYEQIETIKSELFSSIYPVGSVYISVDSTSPATLFGGKWEEIEDVFLLGASTTYPAGVTGGEKEHTLVTKEIPSHKHSYYRAGWNVKGSGWTLGNGGTVQLYTDGDETASTAAMGSGQAHNNMPPYLSVYMWKRIS